MSDGLSRLVEGLTIKRQSLIDASFCLRPVQTRPRHDHGRQIAPVLRWKVRPSNCGREDFPRFPSELDVVAIDGRMFRTKEGVDEVVVSAFGMTGQDVSCDR